MNTTCIIGSGITALAQAWQLKRSGQDVTVLEPGTQIGGAIQSHREGDYLAEAGPNSIQVNSHKVDAFLNSIPGLKERAVTAQPEAQKRFIVREGQLHPVPTGPLSALTSPLWSFPGKLRVLKEPFITPSKEMRDESVADFARRRLGQELYAYAINPLIGGIYAGDPEQLSLCHAFPKLHELEQNHGSLIRGAFAKMRIRKQANSPKFEKRILSFQNGLNELPQAIASALGDALQVNVALESIEQRESQWIVAWNGSQRAFDQLILTTPAHALKSLPLEERLQAALSPLEAIEHPPVSVLSLGFQRNQLSHPLDGFGALIPECEDRNILGVLFPSSLFAQRAPEGEVLMTLFVGGERQPELATSNTEQLLKTVLPELTALLGLTGSPRFIHHKHWPKAIPQYKIGHGEHLARINNIEQNWPGLKLAGNYRTGISLTSCIESAIE